MKRFFGSALLVSVLACVCLWPRPGRGPTGLADLPPSAAQVVTLAQLEERVVALESSLRGLRARCERDPTQPAGSHAVPAPQLPAASARTVPADDSEAADEPTPSFARRYDELLQGEPLDRAHSETLTRSLLARLTHSNPDTRLDSVECSASLCRCVMEHKTRWAQRSIDASFAGLDPQQAGVSYVYDESSEPRVTIAYVARKAGL